MHVAYKTRPPKHEREEQVPTSNDESLAVSKGTQGGILEGELTIGSNYALTRTSRALHDTVDVLCQHCHQLIPFEDVDNHSYKCVYASNHKMPSAADFELQIKEINANVSKIQGAVQ